MAVQITEAEWKIMECLWDHAPQTMGEITAALDEFDTETAAERLKALREQITEQ